MRHEVIDFSGEKVEMYFDSAIQNIFSTEHRETVIITDENVANLHSDKFSGVRTLTIAAGERSKTQSVVDDLIKQLLEIDASKKTMIVGVGGGVVTDIAGYAATIYKRGVSVAFVPTTILAMTDAAIGGKNGVNSGEYKNMVGTIRQPEKIIYDYSFLETLPQVEWESGFAEIIKHACIRDETMFAELEEHTLEFYQSHPGEIAKLIEKNVSIKSLIAADDVFENADRYLLNFGHSFGHAIEKIENLPHGHAVSIGMMIAAKISAGITEFGPSDVCRLENLLKKYNLPVKTGADADQMFSLMKKDKKSDGDLINFVLLKQIGNGTVQKMNFSALREFFKSLV